MVDEPTLKPCKNDTALCINDTVEMDVTTNKEAESDGGPQYKRLTLAQEAQIVRLAAEELGQVRIAEVVGCSQATVSRVLSEFKNTTGAARKLLEAHALQASRDWITSMKPAAEKGDHRPAKELLQAVGVVQKDGPSQAQQIQVMVGMPGQELPDPFAEGLSPQKVSDLEGISTS